jgi:uncharacterized membrane protein
VHSAAEASDFRADWLGEAAASAVAAEVDGQEEAAGRVAAARQGAGDVRADELLDAAERMRIETAVHDIEASTSGEIVVCVVDSCGEYGSAGWRFGCVLAALTLLGVTWGWPDVSATTLLAGQTVALAVAHALARIPVVRRWLLEDTLID